TPSPAADQAGSPRRRARDAVSGSRSRPSLRPFWHRPFSPPRLRTAANAPYGEPPLVLRDQSAALRSSNRRKPAAPRLTCSMLNGPLPYENTYRKPPMMATFFQKWTDWFITWSAGTAQNE